MMNEPTDREDPQSPTTPVQCAVCRIAIPLDEAVVPELADRLVYLCGLDCYARWREAAARSFASL
jgi:hypothetical protein